MAADVALEWHFSSRMRKMQLRSSIEAAQTVICIQTMSSVSAFSMRAQFALLIALAVA